MNVVGFFISNFCFSSEIKTEQKNKANITVETPNKVPIQQIRHFDNKNTRYVLERKKKLIKYRINGCEFCVFLLFLMKKV